MQTEQIQDRFERARQSIHTAVQALHETSSSTPELLQPMQELEQGADAAGRLIEQGTDAEGIVQAIDRLESAADRAVGACRHNEGEIDPRLPEAVQRAHDELSQLKHALH